MCAIESNKTQNLFRASSLENFVLGIELKFKSQSKLLIFSPHCLRVIFIFHANNAKGIKTKLNHHIDNHKLYLHYTYVQDCFGGAIASFIVCQQVAQETARSGICINVLVWSLVLFIKMSSLIIIMEQTRFKFWIRLHRFS